LAEIYLDNSATTRVLPDAVEAMKEACSLFYGNPSSLHGKGLQAEKRVEGVRESLATILGCSTQELYFTSGGTESNNWAILGSLSRRSRRGRHCITTRIEHASVLNVFKHLESSGYQVSYLDADDSGVVDPEQLKSCLRDDTVLVSVMYVNNETGATQPVQEIGEVIKAFKSDIVFHVDGVQALGKLPLNVGKSCIDLMSFSAHKIHGPKGVGSLYIRKGAGIDPLFLGGEQERRMRAGTENVPGIVGFGAALSHIPNSLKETAHICALKEQLLTLLKERLPEMYVNGSVKNAVPHILNLSFPGVKGEVLVHYLEQSGIYISTGSACHSRSAEYSHVLAAMGIEGDRLEGAVRVSFSHFNTPEEVALAARKMAEAVKDLQSLKIR